MITLHEKDALAATLAQKTICTLPDAMECRVTEERNGAYDLELIYPISGANASEIAVTLIVVCEANESGTRQPFRIYKIVKNLREMTVSAHHISYDLSKYIISTNYQPGSISCGTCINYILNHNFSSQGVTGFSYNTDITTTSTNFRAYVGNSARACLGGTEKSVLDIFGGEFEWNDWTVNLWKSRGSDNGVRIEYAKNLINLDYEESSEDYYVGCFAYWNATETTKGVLPFRISDKQDSADITSWRPYPYYALDCSQDYQSIPTKAQLNSKALAWINAHDKLIPETIKVDLAAIWQTTDYEKFAELERVNLCDYVTVYYPNFDISAKRKVTKTVYNVVAGRYDSVELGTITTVADTIANNTVLATTEKEQRVTQDSVTITSGIFSKTRHNSISLVGAIATVCIDATFTSTSAKSWTNIGSVPYAPLLEQQGAFWGGGTTSGLFRIETDGTIDVTTVSGVAQCRFTATYVIGE